MDSMITARQLIEHLNLKPLLGEGGYYKLSYTSSICLDDQGQNESDCGTSSPICSTIFYLITPDSFSTLHALNSDEIWHFYAGDPAEQFLLYPDGEVETRILGTSLLTGQIPQSIAPANVWQGTRLLEGGRWALFGTTVAPAYQHTDYKQGDFFELSKKFPRHKDRLEYFCKD